MPSGSFLCGPDSYRDWKLRTSMFKKSEAVFCLLVPRLDYALNGRSVRLRPMGCESWRCYSQGLFTLHLYLCLCCPPPHRQHGTKSCVSGASMPTWCPVFDCWGKGDWLQPKDWALTLPQCADLSALFEWQCPLARGMRSGSGTPESENPSECRGCSWKLRVQTWRQEMLPKAE